MSTKTRQVTLEGGGTLVLATGAAKPRWRGPGTLRFCATPEKTIFFYHAYDADHNGRPTLRIAPLGWTEDNWPARLHVARRAAARRAM